MREKSGVGVGIFMLVLLLATGVSALSLIIGGAFVVEGRLGLCLPSPNNWNLNQNVSWGINLALILIMALWLSLANKRYNFINSQSLIFPAIFITLVCLTPMVSFRLTSSTLLALTNIYSIWKMYKTYRESRSMVEYFEIGSLIAIGSMFQYGFLFFIVAYVIIGIIMKSLNLKTFTAMMLGVIAPYWIVVGLGLIKLQDFSMPTLSNLFDEYMTKRDLLIGLLNLVITAVMSLLIGLNNAVKLYAGNTARRLMVNSINILGLVSVVCMICDFSNPTTYIITFYIAASVQFASVFSLNNVKKQDPWLMTIFIIYAVSAILMLYPYLTLSLGPI